MSESAILMQKPNIFGWNEGLQRADGGPRRRAKIVCTIGPASNSEHMIRELMLRGMDVARLNFSHGTHEQHALVIDRLRRSASELNRTTLRPTGRPQCCQVELQCRSDLPKRRAPVLASQARLQSPTRRLGRQLASTPLLIDVTKCGDGCGDPHRVDGAMQEESCPSPGPSSWT